MDRRRLEESLERHRREIESLDAEILRLVARRSSIACEIGQLKRNARIPLRDFDVESRVVARYRARATELGLDEAFGEDLAVFLIRRAVELQSPILDSVYDGDRMNVLVVGGLGGMGRWISSFLSVQGHAVKVHDPEGAPGPFPRAESLAAGVEWAALTVLAVPITTTANLLREIASLNPSGVVAEMASVKSHLIPVIDEIRSRGTRAVSFHPMFGPAVRILSGKQIVVCRAGHEADEAVVAELFTATSAHVVPVDLADHDRYMAAVLGMAHLLNLGFARALDRFGLPFAELEVMSGVTFRKQIDTTREVASESEHLYYEIQEQNPHTDGALRELIRSFEELRSILDAADEAHFAELMRAGRRFFEVTP